MNKQKKSAEVIKYIFVGVIVLAVTVSLAGVTPTGDRKIIFNYFSMYIALGCSAIFFMSGIAYRIYDENKLMSWISRYLISITIMPAVIGVACLNLVYASFPSWKVIAPLGAMYVLAAMLPLLNEKLSETLHTEIFAPRSCLGRVIAMSVLSLAPIAGIFGAFLSGVAERHGGTIGYSLMGLVFHFFFVWGTISMAYQAWERRAWKSSNHE